MGFDGGRDGFVCGQRFVAMGTFDLCLLHRVLSCLGC